MKLYGCTARKTVPHIDLTRKAHRHPHESYHSPCSTSSKLLLEKTDWIPSMISSVRSGGMGRARREPIRRVPSIEAELAWIKTPSGSVHALDSMGRVLRESEREIDELVDARSRRAHQSSSRLRGMQAKWKAQGGREDGPRCFRSGASRHADEREQPSWSATIPWQVREGRGHEPFLILLVLRTFPDGPEVLYPRPY